MALNIGRWPASNGQLMKTWLLFLPSIALFRLVDSPARSPDTATSEDRLNPRHRPLRIPRQSYSSVYKAWWTLRPALIIRAHAADPIHANTYDQSLLIGLPKRILVGSEKAFGKLVDVLVGTGVSDSRFAVEDRVCLRVVA